MRFTYACGQRPLAGYTIKRGISRGGFGEVYFGLSDGGKEVALKCLFRNQDIEVRGVRQCLNLKHPHLVHLYDLRKDEEGHDWLVMEFVRGETLHAVLQRHAKGLDHDLVMQWFSQIAAAVHALHEQGIVHRDLKPANVFLENGQVKVGDYGLCKFTGASQHRGHTENVGTVHYMAPEVGKGSYTRAVDVYAAGILLYEMLTGRVPFEGETTAEILLKHLSAAPDLDGTGRFAPTLRRALEKNPADRFATLAEMARRVAEPEAPGAPAPRNVPAFTRVPTAPVAPLTAAGQPPSPETTVLLPARATAGQTVNAMFLAGCLTLGFSFAWALVFLPQLDFLRAAPMFLVTALSSWVIVGLGRSWDEVVDDSLSRRLLQGVAGAAVGLFAVWVQGYALLGTQPLAPPEASRHPFYGAIYPDNRALTIVTGHVAYFALMFLVLRWWKCVEPGRPMRFAVPAVLATALWAFVLLFLLPTADERQIGFWSTVLTSIVVQLASPWRSSPEETPQRRMRLRYA